eukprot:365605-Chlamydomonas_euryale.AAC.6
MDSTERRYWWDGFDRKEILVGWIRQKGDIGGMDSTERTGRFVLKRGLVGLQSVGLGKEDNWFEGWANTNGIDGSWNLLVGLKKRIGGFGLKEVWGLGPRGRHRVGLALRLYPTSWTLFGFALLAALEEGRKGGKRGGREEGREAGEESTACGCAAHMNVAAQGRQGQPGITHCATARLLFWHHTYVALVWDAAQAFSS